MQRRLQSHALVGLLACSALALCASPAASAAACEYRNSTPRTTNVSKIRSAVRCLVNHERTSRGIAALKHSGALTTASQGHSKRMVSLGFFDHVEPDGSTHVARANAAGYPGMYIGENIAAGTGSLATPRKIVSSWMHSSGHKANILNPQYRDQGVGVAIGYPSGGSGATYTNMFGRHG